MPDLSLVILYVNNPSASQAFYADLLGRQPVESSQNFAMFVMDSGAKLGVWSKDAVEPATIGTPGAGELVFAVADRDSLLATEADWKKRGLSIAQEATDMDFGFTFVALDPDGHRLRVFTPTEE